MRAYARIPAHIYAHMCAYARIPICEFQQICKNQPKYAKTLGIIKEIHYLRCAAEWP